MIRNLGQVAAIYIGSSAPRNTNLIWLDNTVVPFVFRAYDGSAWSEIATHKWVRAYVDGWLVTLPPRQLADDGDYMLINSNNVNYKITVKDFVKSAVGNPLDFKGVIRVSADFPNPSTLESGDMYVIITSPAGGTVTDPYSGKTFEDSEKIVWDEVTRSWESLGKINITVNLTTSYSETEVTIHSSAGKETTIQGATDQLAGVMLPGQYSWLQALSNGSIVPGDPSPLTPLTPAHKHNYNDIINRLVSQQGTGESTIDPMSQKATTDALNLKFDKASVLQVSGAATDKVMSQKAVTDALKTLSDDFNNKLTNYLPLAGGTMKGSIRFPVGLGIVCEDVSGSAAYGVLRTWNYNGSTRMYIGTVNFPTYISSTASDLIHDRNGSSYLLWDSYNLPTPASTTDLNNYLPLIGGTLTGQLTIKQEADIKLRLQSTDADNHCIIQAINSQASQLGVFGYAGDKWVIGHNGTYYEIWDKYNLTNPVTYTTNTYNHATLTNKDGQYFTYIKAGTNGLLPHSKATLVSGGSGSLGTSDQSFNAAYINNLHTNKITFGVAGSFIDNQSGDSDHIGIGFYTSQNAACPVYVGSLCVSDGYANSAPNIPTNGIYSKGVIKSAAGFTSNSRQTNLNLASTAAYSLYISSFIEGSTSAPGVDPISGRIVNDGVLLTYFWGSDFAFQLAGDIDGSGIAYRSYAPSTGVSSLGWRFLADTNWVVSKINSSTSNFLKKTGDTATGQIILDSNGIAFKANTWTNDLTPNKNYSGYLQVLDAYNASSAEGPTNYGTVLQVNSRNAHWANQLWFPGGAEASKNGLYYRHMAYNETKYGNWIKLATTSDLGNYLPLSGGTISSSKPYPLIINSTHVSQSSINFSREGVDKGTVGFYESLGSFLQNVTGETLAVKSDGAYYGANIDSLRKLATVTDLNNYLPLTGGTLNGALTINGPNTLYHCTLNSSYTRETVLSVQRKGIYKAAFGYYDGIGAFLYNYPSAKYLFVDDNGDARVGTTNGSTKLALITDIPTVSGYLPLSGGTLTGALTMNSRKNNAVIDVVGGTGNNWNGGAGALSVQVPVDEGQTPLLVARRSGAAIDTTVAKERLLSMELLDDGHSFIIGMSGSEALQLDWTSGKVGTGKLFGKQIATTDQIPSIPSISITTSGSGSVVTGISASGHTLTVTKGSASMSVSWNDITGKPSSFTPSAHTHNYLTVLDNRDVTMLPNNIGGSGRFQTFFNMTGMPDSQWWSGIWVNGWTDTYASWQLAGPSLYGTPPANGLYFRSGVNTTWNSWKRVAFADEIPTRTSDLTNNSGFLTSSSLSGYATQSWANEQFASLSLYNTTGSYTTIRTRGNEFCLGNTIATSASNEVIVNYRIPSGCTYAPSTWVWRAGSSTSYANGYWGSLYMNGDLVATQTWVNNKGYLTSHQTIYNLTFQAGTFSAKTFDPNGAAATVNIPTNTSHLTNDSGFITSSALNGYATQAWVNSQNFVKSTSTKKVTDIQPVDALPATQASGVLYLVFG